MFLFLGAELLSGGVLRALQMGQHLAVRGDRGELAAEKLVQGADVAFHVAAAG
jgi:hypothetical protein